MKPSAVHSVWLLLLLVGCVPRGTFLSVRPVLGAVDDAASDTKSTTNTAATTAEAAASSDVLRRPEPSDSDGESNVNKVLLLSAKKERKMGRSITATSS
jgi:hypothetical protein